MCGRFTLTKTSEEIIAYLASFPITNLDSLTELKPRYNISPTQSVLAIALIDNQWQCLFFRWGLIPHWTKPPLKTNPLINARQETLAQKSSFKEAFAQRRCLILADGFYEWNQSLYQKHPLYFKRENHSLFAFAGLWESWRSPEGEIINSTTIINTSAVGIMQEIHPRMPIVLSPDAYEAWLNPELKSKTDLNLLLSEQNSCDFSYYPVSEKVNSVKNNYADLLNLKKVIVTEQLSLF